MKPSKHVKAGPSRAGSANRWVPWLVATVIVLAVAGVFIRQHLRSGLAPESSAQASSATSTPGTASAPGQTNDAARVPDTDHSEAATGGAPSTQAGHETHRASQELHGAHREVDSDHTEPITRSADAMPAPSDRVSTSSLDGAAAGSEESQRHPPPPARPTVPVPDPATPDLRPNDRARLRAARDALVAKPASAESWANFGAACDTHKLYDCAETCYRQAFALRPDEFSYPYLLARVLHVTGRGSEEVVGLLQTAERLRSDYAPIAWRLGQAFEKQGRLEEAVDAYQRSVKIDSSLAVGYRQAGKVLLALGRLEPALQHLKRAAALGPYDGAAFAALAQVYDRLGQPDRAGKAAATARTYDPVPDVPDPVRDSIRSLAIGVLTISSRGQDSVQAGEYAEAIPDLALCEAANPDDALIQVFLATCYRSTGQLDLAKTHATRALQLEQDSFVAHVELAMVFAKKHRLERAMAHYRRAQALQPDNILIDGWVGDVLVQEGYLDEGIAAFEHAATLGMVDAHGHWMWGLALGDKGDLDGAIEHFEESARLNPRHAGTFYSLGMALERTGRRDEAIEAYARAVDIDPTHRAAQRLAELKAGNP